MEKFYSWCASYGLILGLCKLNSFFLYLVFTIEGNLKILFAVFAILLGLVGPIVIERIVASRAKEFFQFLIATMGIIPLWTIPVSMETGIVLTIVYIFAEMCLWLYVKTTWNIFQIT